MATSRTASKSATILYGGCKAFSRNSNNSYSSSSRSSSNSSSAKGSDTSPFVSGDDATATCKKGCCCRKCKKSLTFVVPDLLYAIVCGGLLDVLNECEKIKVLKKLVWIVRSSQANAEILSNFCLDSSLLDRYEDGGWALFERYANDVDPFTEEFVELLVSTWTYGISSKDLRALMSAIHKSSFHPTLIQILNRMTSSDGPCCYAHQSSRSPVTYFVTPPLPHQPRETLSGLQKTFVPTLPDKQWPAKRFSVDFWVSYEFGAESDSKKDRVKVFDLTCTHNERACGYSLSIASDKSDSGTGHFAFTVAVPPTGDSSNDETFMFSETNVRENEWTHVVITYEGKPTCECKLYVNGALAEIVPVTHLSPGCSHVSQLTLQIGNGSPVQPGTLRLSSAYFFSDVLTPLSVTLLNALGPSYNGSFAVDVDFSLYTHCVNLGSSSSPPSEHVQRLLLSPESCTLEPLRSKLIAVFVAPRAFIAESATLHARPKTPLTAISGVASARSVKNTLTDVGGLALVLYMLGVACTKEQQQDVLRFLVGVLHGNPEMAVQMRRLKGYQLLSRLMRKSTWIVDEDLLELVFSMAGLRKTAETDLYDCGAIADIQAFSSLVLDWDIWSRGPEQLRTTYCRCLRATVTSAAASAFNVKRMSQCEAVAEFIAMLQTPQPSAVTSELADLIRVVVSRAAATSLSRKGVRAVSDFLLSTYRIPKVVTYNVDSESHTRVRSRSAAAAPGVTAKRRLHLSKRGAVAATTTAAVPTQHVYFATSGRSPPLTPSQRMQIPLPGDMWDDIDDNGDDDVVGRIEDSNSLKRTFMLEMLLDILSKAQNPAIREEMSDALPVEAIVYMLQHSDKEFNVLLLRLLFYSFQQDVPQPPAQQQQQQRHHKPQKAEEKMGTQGAMQKVNLKCANYCKFVKLDGFNLVGMALQESTPTKELFGVLFWMLVGESYPSDLSIGVSDAVSLCVMNTKKGGLYEFGGGDKDENNEFRLACPEALKAIMFAAASPSSEYVSQNSVVKGLHKICNMSDCAMVDLLKNGLIRGLFNILRARIFKRKAARNDDAFDPDDIITRNVNKGSCAKSKSKLEERFGLNNDKSDGDEEDDEDILSLLNTIIIKTCEMKGPVSHCFEEVMALCRSEERFSYEAGLDLQNRILEDTLEFFFENPKFYASKKLFASFVQLAQTMTGFVCWRDGILPVSTGSVSPKMSRVHNTNSCIESFTPTKRTSRTLSSQFDRLQSSQSLSGFTPTKSQQEKFLRFKRVAGGKDAVTVKFLRKLDSLVCELAGANNNSDSQHSAAAAAARQTKSYPAVAAIVWRVLYHVLRGHNTELETSSKAVLHECFNAFLSPVLSEALLKEATSPCVSACTVCLVKYLAFPEFEAKAMMMLDRLKESSVAKYIGHLAVCDSGAPSVSASVADKIEKNFGLLVPASLSGVQEGLVDDAVKWEHDMLGLAEKFQASQRDLSEAYATQEATLKRFLKGQVSYVLDVAGSLQWKTLTGPLVERNERGQRDAIDAHTAWKAIFRMCTHERALFSLVLHTPFRRLKLCADHNSQKLRWTVSDPAERTLNPPYASVSCTTSRSGSGSTRGVLIRVVSCKDAPGVYRVVSDSNDDAGNEQKCPNVLPHVKKVAPLFQTTLCGDGYVRITGSGFSDDPGFGVFIGGQRAEIVEVKSPTEVIVRSVAAPGWGFYEVFAAQDGFFQHEHTKSYGYLELNEYRQYVTAKNAVFVDPAKEYEYAQPTAGIDREALEEATSNAFQYPVRRLVVRMDGTPFLTKNVFRTSRDRHNNSITTTTTGSSTSSSSRDIGDLSCVHIPRNERVSFNERCVWISVYAERDGEVVLTQKRISFFGPDSVRVSWSYDDICEMHTRRYVLRDVAVEIFFVTGKTCFLAFGTTAARDMFLRVVRQASLPNLCNSSNDTNSSSNSSTTTTISNGSNSEGTSSNNNSNSSSDTNDSSTSGASSILSGWRLNTVASRWVNGHISNYEYLMCLNIRAGRTFNDLNQYPVFPWVLADYTSETLDLSNPTTFRDLSKPMGAQTAESAAFYAEKYEQLAETEEAPYHYATHYSSADGVIYYLSRLEPFATFHVVGRQEGNRFDVPDRLFYDVGATWSRSSGGAAAASGHGNVRELIPEFFTLPEMFDNANNFDFGERQDGSRVHGVRLPPWAKSDPREFVRLHRAALESEYVSAHLHEWIDLIFGCKQQSKEALNVFHPYTCEGGIDWDAIKDPAERLSRQMQVNLWGQTPRKLFSKPHPPRNMRIVCATLAVPPFDPQLAAVSSPLRMFHSTGPVADIAFTSVGTPSAISPAHTSADRNSCFHVWDNWDNTIRTVSKETGKTLIIVPTVDAGDRIVAGRISRSGSVFVCGSLHGVVLVWKRRAPDALVLASKCRALYGHTGKITAIDIDNIHSVVVTGSDDSTCIVWSIMKLEYLCTLRHANPVVCVCAAQANDSIYSVEKVTGGKSAIHEWTMNGTLITSLTLPFVYTAPLFTAKFIYAYLCGLTLF